MTADFNGQVVMPITITEVDKLQVFLFIFLSYYVFNTVIGFKWYIF